MSAKPQVRLDPDVAEVLQRAADRGERSLSAEANVRLRRALGMTAPHLVGAGSASVRAPGAACMHPRARRVKGQCMACGRHVGPLAAPSTTRR